PVRLPRTGQATATRCPQRAQGQARSATNSWQAATIRRAAILPRIAQPTRVGPRPLSSSQGLKLVAFAARPTPDSSPPQRAMRQLSLAWVAYPQPRAPAETHRPARAPALTPVA